MNNEIGRKITSLTLMTIMLASAFAAGAPSVLPQAAAANANLFVSAESSQFQNYIGGPMVVEVVVIDSDIKDTDKGKGEPDVTINGNDFRMVQATDGNWYGYFADRAQAQTADQTVVGKTAGQGLDFGEFCTTTGLSTIFGFTISGAVGVAVPTDGLTGATNGITPLTDCTAFAVGAEVNNVVRENKTVNPGSSIVPIGQIGFLNQNAYQQLWPFIQLYNFQQGGNVVVQYNKGGGVQSTTLKFDTADQFAKVELDRTSYPQSAQVHATITDLMLNIDPTDEDSWSFGTNATNSTVGTTTSYQVFTENGVAAGAGVALGIIDVTDSLSSMMFEDNGILKVNTNQVLALQDNADNLLVNTSGNAATINDLPEDVLVTGSSSSGYLGINTSPVTITETAPNTGVFGTYDEGDKSNLIIAAGALRGTAATIDYNDSPRSVKVGFGFATVDMQLNDAEWKSGQEIPVVITDSDANKNSRADEDLDFYSNSTELIPALKTGTPATLYDGITAAALDNVDIYIGTGNTQKYSERHLFKAFATNLVSDGEFLTVNFTSLGKAKVAIPFANTNFKGFGLLNYDVRSLKESAGIPVNTVDIALDFGAHTPQTLGTSLPLQGLVNITQTQWTYITGSTLDSDPAEVTVTLNTGADHTVVADTVMPMAFDFFGYGYINDGTKAVDRVSNQIIRIEAEETGDNTGTFNGSLEFIMLNQLNILDYDTYSGLETISNSPNFVVIDDLDEELAPRVNYNDKGADGVTTQVSDQVDAPTHSGVVSFDKTNYKIADTVTVTLEDTDLNTDVDLLDIYTTIPAGNTHGDIVGVEGLPDLSNGDYLGRLLDITFDDELWNAQAPACVAIAVIGDDGLYDTDFTLVETGPATGIFTGDFQVPGNYCADVAGKGQISTTGKDMEVNYVDFRDASGNIVEVGDGAGIRANTGSISLDRTVYPVPWGNIQDTGALTTTTPSGVSVFPIHKSGLTGPITSTEEILDEGDLTVHIQVNDPDYDISASGEDKIADDSTTGHGPVKVTVKRGANGVILATAGNDTPSTQEEGKITIGTTLDVDAPFETRELGPITETAPNSGIFEFELAIRYTDGPSQTELCPTTEFYKSATNSTYGLAGDVTARFALPGVVGDDPTGRYCIIQGDILTVEYTDSTDASGNPNTVTDSATFDLRNGALQSDKSVYIIGSDMILTLIEPDFDLDNDQAETYDLDLIEWDSDAATCTIGNQKGVGDCNSPNDSFDPEPSDLRETGDSTGIFQSIIEIPSTLGDEKLERGEEIVLEYTDWGPSGSDYVGDEDTDVNLTIFTSNFGATVELDQKVYTWTDKVYITIVAPDHNMDSNLVDTIGDTSEDAVKVATRGHDLNEYSLAETGPDTGIFTGEVILTGFAHDADGDGTADGPFAADLGNGPTDGTLQADDDDGLTVSFEFSEDETVVGSALIRWNIGEVSWLEASYPASGTGVIRVIDPDMNWNPEAVDNFDVNVWSDSDAGGIDLTVTETNEATGIFEGTVFFTTSDDSSGARLRVAEGDTVTAEYKDNTLPDPYTRADELDITGTSFIGTVVPPLERAPATGARVVDAFGNTLDNVSVDQQVQITADLTNGQDREQSFAYLVQIQDENGVTVSLAWITGSLSAGQSFSPALSWIPTASGTYTATVFVWESVDNPTALSPPVSVDITVS